MPFVPFHKGSTTVQKKASVAPAKPAKPVKNATHNSTRVPKPSGAGPAGSAGYFDN